MLLILNQQCIQVTLTAQVYDARDCSVRNQNCLCLVSIAIMHEGFWTSYLVICTYSWQKACLNLTGNFLRVYCFSVAKLAYEAFYESSCLSVSGSSSNSFQDLYICIASLIINTTWPSETGSQNKTPFFASIAHSHSDEGEDFSQVCLHAVWSRQAIPSLAICAKYAEQLR